MTRANLDIDLNGSSSTIAETFAAILTAVDAHPNGYTICAQFSNQPHAIGLQTADLKKDSTDALLLKEVFTVAQDQAEAYCRTRSLIILQLNGITTLGELRMLSRSKLYEITGIGDKLGEYLERQLNIQGFEYPLD